MGSVYVVVVSVEDDDDVNKSKILGVISPENSHKPDPDGRPVSFTISRTDGDTMKFLLSQGETVATFMSDKIDTQRPLKVTSHQVITLKKPN